MMNRLPPSVRRPVSVFAGFTGGQKAVTLVGLAAVILGGFFFANWAAAPSYAPLFSNLSGTDASAIVDELSSAGTPYELADGGQTIMVPQDQVYDLRIRMSGAGLPAEAESGYSLLDKQGITASEFMQHVGYQRALEGELAKTIESIDGVTSATVHLAIPQKDIFSDDEQKPTASVLVAAKVGKAPNQQQVQSIVHLVASSVEGLEPEQVTVAGANGVVLSTGDGQSLAAGGDLRSQQTVDFQSRMDTALQRMLDSVVGPGHAVVTTTADLDFDSTETKTERYTADPTTPPLSQSTTKETYTGTESGAGGVLGDDNPAGGAQNGDGNYESTTDVRNNAVGTVTETRKSAPGNVRRLSVSVLMDSRTAEGVDAAEVEKLVSAAVGLDTARGDTIAVTALPFDQTAEEEAKKAVAEADQADQLAQYLSYGKTGGVVLAAIVLLFLGWRASRRSARRTGLTAAEVAHLQQAQAALERSQSTALPGRAAAAELGGGSGDGAGGRELTGPAEPARVEPAVRRREISVLIEQQPEDVAQLLRSWLADRRT
jgi:flagellar M-ring protein FliF